MGFWNLFKKKEEQLTQENNSGEIEGRNFIDKDCCLCGTKIGYEKYSKPMGHFYHKKCFKKMRKAGKI